MSVGFVSFFNVHLICHSRCTCFTSAVQWFFQIPFQVAIESQQVYPLNGACANTSWFTRFWMASPVILWISLGGKPKWLPLKFGYHDVMRTSPILFFFCFFLLKCYFSRSRWPRIVPGNFSAVDILSLRCVVIFFQRVYFCWDWSIVLRSSVIMMD